MTVKHNINRVGRTVRVEFELEKDAITFATMLKNAGEKKLKGE